ncbi:MAG TPA: phosphoribosyltransferase [Steroidobacteraceae bacterium]|nr:phosphoribosyltransferase [Steroidobacteraceae bacterium]
MEQAIRQPARATPFFDISFCSCYVYAPRGGGWRARSSRVLCRRVKAIDPLWLPRYAAYVYRCSLQDRELASLFESGAALVPVPGSARTGDAAWAALALAMALSRVGFGLPVWSGLWRRHAVIKSATALPAARPTVQQHYDSFAVASVELPLRRIVLIDDVITRGRTLLAAAARLRSTVPCADIRAFALIRTRGFAAQLPSITDTCHGVVRWSGDDARREP